LKFLDIKIFDALMLSKYIARVFFVTNLAHDLDLRTIFSNVVVKLSTSHMLILFTVADITTELWAIELSMCLELIQSLPDDFTMAII
jgi:hypothetical protein